VRENTPVQTPDGNGGVPLREYIERIFDEKQKALELAFAAQQKALELATRSMELRLEKLNELRSEVTRDRSQFVRQDVFEGKQDSLEKSIHDLEKAIITRLDFLEGWRLRAVGIFLVLLPLAGVIGAAIMKALS
jgi:hypothetical protein